jgi:hypothetical protein
MPHEFRPDHQPSLSAVGPFHSNLNENNYFDAAAKSSAT